MEPLLYVSTMKSAGDSELKDRVGIPKSHGQYWINKGSLLWLRYAQDILRAQKKDISLSLGEGKERWWEMAGRTKDSSKNAMIAALDTGKLAHIWFLMFVILSVNMFQTFIEIDRKKYMHMYLYMCTFKYTQK